MQSTTLLTLSLSLSHPKGLTLTCLQSKNLCYQIFILIECLQLFSVFLIFVISIMPYTLFLSIHVSASPSLFLSLYLSLSLSLTQCFYIYFRVSSQCLFMLSICLPFSLALFKCIKRCQYISRVIHPGCVHP